MRTVKFIVAGLILLAVLAMLIIVGGWAFWIALALAAAILWAGYTVLEFIDGR